MTGPWTHWTIRARLTVWYAGVLTAMLIVYAVSTFIAVRHEFLEQLDERLHDDFEAAEGRLTRTSDGRVAWVADAHQDGHDVEAKVYEVWSASGEQIHRSGAPTGLPSVALGARATSYAYETVVATTGETWRTITAPVTVGGYNVVLRVSRLEERVREELSEVGTVLALGLPLVVALAGLGGYVLARRALAPIDHVAREVASSLGVLVEERNQALSVDAAEGIVAAVDRLVFREALTNVLDNALKYSPSGGAIAIRVVRTDEGALVAVSDQGPGVPPEHRARIFDRFFRVDDSRTRDTGGAGLGLAIAKWAVEIHGGQITVDERPGGGAEFRIAVPLDSRP